MFMVAKKRAKTARKGTRKRGRPKGPGKKTRTGSAASKTASRRKIIQRAKAKPTFAVKHAEAALERRVVEAPRMQPEPGAVRLEEEARKIEQEVRKDIKELSMPGMRARASGICKKSRFVALMLALFLGPFTWLYTYKKDWWKFWTGLILDTILLASIVLALGIVAVWLWAIVDVLVKDDNWYNNFPC